ncbi:MAG: shikimate kinase [Candidatus Cloacimonetes bacterium]|jgi:shikimate kinase|nr:hypothetical protein [Candidatus Cloacimonadota bacterium]MDD2506631.1 shikimate kinase [Candidatus Cloacimonadota bacterium]MDD4147429.1 shikimate kinase [Candidatus Cloacimonadota bacterium]MDD4560762.1 shikimate kinase [Candidatus Cloacimonadota bacterium]
MLLYIIGFSGAGKSTLARKLSVSWKIPAWDTDDLFCAKQGQSISDYVTKNGWLSFREKESEILRGTGEYDAGSLSSVYSYSGLIACGGGVVEMTENRDFLRSKSVLWLAPAWDVLLHRIHQSPADFCKDKSDAELWASYRYRLPLYRDCLRIKFPDKSTCG